MSDVLIDQGTMEDIGDSIRSKLGVQTTYLPSEMPSAIMSISGGGDTLVIQDASIYSEDEQQVGVWTDGKPLYQKTFNFVNVTTRNSWVITNHNISNIDKITDYNAIFTRTSDNWTVKADHYEGSSTAYISSNADKTQIHFKIAISSGTYNGSFTICYTKTTDQPGSGGYKAYGLSPIIYSEEEREVGVWTDGKPLYQKTINFGALPNNTSKSVAHGISNIDYVSYIGGVTKSSSGGIPISFAHRSNISNQVQIGYDATNINIFTATDQSAYTKCFITLQYTKTTDTPGSGIWTTTGEYAHHYSTDEHVIGTWIDGSTIYERTLPFTFSPVSDWVLFNDDVSYDKLLSADGYIVLSNGEVHPFVSQSVLIPRWITKTDHKLYYYTTENRAGYVTFQYTKTT